MGINQKTAKVPFWVLFGLVSFITVFDLVFTYIFLSNNPAANEGNPVHAYFANIFGLEYFFVMMPVSLLALFGIIKLGAWAIRRIDKHTEINGENYMAVILILLAFPNMLINEILLVLFGMQMLRFSFDPALMLAVILTLIYIILAELDDKAQKRKRGIKK